MRTATIDLYKFDELNEEAQEKAICEHIEFEIEVMDRHSPYYECAEEMDRMQTPWFLGQVIFEKHKQDIIDNITLNEYLFFDDGNLIPLDYYRG